MQRFRAVDNIWQRLAMNVSHGWMEKTGPDIARCFDDGRNPRSIAAGGNMRALSDVGSEVLNNPT